MLICYERIGTAVVSLSCASNAHTGAQQRTSQRSQDALEGSLMGCEV